MVLDYGAKIADGTPASVRDDPKVIGAYLGVTGEEVEGAEAEAGLWARSPTAPRHAYAGGARGEDQ